MFINARPRIVSNGFEPFVPIQRAELLHQNNFAMANNDVNAWGLFRSVASPTDNWDQHLEDLGNDNLPLHTLYPEYYQDTTTAQAQPGNLPKAPNTYAGLQQNQSQQAYRRTAGSQQGYQEAVSEMNCLENQSPMLGDDYTQWSFGSRNSSFADFSTAQNALKTSPYRTSNEADLTSFTSAISLAQSQSSYQGTSGSSDILTMNRTSPDTVYSNYSPSNASTDPLLTGCLAPNPREMSIRNTWWPEGLQPNKSQYQDTYGIVIPQDGLPRAQLEQEQQAWNQLWNTGDGSTNNWASKSAAPATVSPKALTLNVSSAPLSSSDSSQGAALSLSDSNRGFSSGEDHSDLSGPETLAVVKPRPPIRRPRHILPDSIPLSERKVPVVPSNDFTASKTIKRRPLKAKPDSQYTSSTPDVRILPSQKIEPATQRLSTPKRIEPKSVEPSARQTWTESPQTSQSTAVQATHHRDAKDDFLVRSKLAGMSYKDIRRQGNFTEAESTLRGRFRTLTKHKTARVRKPEWNENDIRLLKKAVRKLAHGSDPNKSRIPWKQVAEYISNNGGSYHFGNATCRKRWDELQGQSES